MTTSEEVTAVVLAELARAESLFPPFRSAHEGIAITREEYVELEQEVFWGPTKSLGEMGDRDRTADERCRILMRDEAIQLAAMAMRFVKDVTGL